MNHHLSNKSCHFGESSAEFTAIGSAFKDFPSFRSLFHGFEPAAGKKIQLSVEWKVSNNFSKLFSASVVAGLANPAIEGNLIEKILIEAGAGAGKGVSSYSCHDLSRYTIWLSGSWESNKQRRFKRKFDWFLWIKHASQRLGTAAYADSKSISFQAWRKASRDSASPKAVSNNCDAKCERQTHFRIEIVPNRSRGAL